MADEIDLAQEREQIATTSALNRIREQAARIDPGEPGECDRCGEQSPRLIRGTCARCRDKWRLP